jgi:hypothetical protein
MDLSTRLNYVSKFVFTLYMESIFSAMPLLLNKDFNITLLPFNIQPADENTNL